MGIHEATREIRKSENRIFQEWLCDVHDSGYHGRVSVDRKYFSMMLDTVAAAMETADENLTRSRFDSSAEWDFPGLHIIKESGITLEAFLAGFKVMIRCIERVILHSDATRLRMRNIADAM
jgi:hypothetical protein